MLTLAPVFHSHMILQAERPIRIFGQSDAPVTAVCGGATSAATPENGAFLLTLPAVGYGEMRDITLTSGTATITLHAVLFGDLYLFSGQSNMEYKLKDTTEDGAIAENPEIRMFYSERVVPNSDAHTPCDGWIPVTKESAPNMSAVAYYTARELYKKKPRPIGLLVAYNGASVIESWLSEESLAKLDFGLTKEDYFPDHYIKDYIWNIPSTLYRLDILPLFPLVIHSVVWYQGESNTGAGEADYYDRMLSELVASYRRGFQNDALPFVIVQIADWKADPLPEWHDKLGWEIVQRKQADFCAAAPHCTLAVSRDKCETDDIHPKTKHILARHIAELL